MQQKTFIACKQHPDCTMDMFVNITPKRNLQRFTCVECYQEHLESGASPQDFLTIQKLISDPLALFRIPNREKGMYDVFIDKYVPLLKYDIEQVQYQLKQIIDETKEKIIASLELIRKQNKKQIEQFKCLKEAINITKVQLSHTIGLEQFKNDYHFLVESHKNRDSEEWRDLCYSIETVIQRVSEQTSDEFRMQFEELDRLFIDTALESVKEPAMLIQAEISTEIDLMIQKLQRSNLKQGPAPIRLTKSQTVFVQQQERLPMVSNLLDPKMMRLIIDQIQQSRPVHDSNLVYRMSRDGQSYAQFWNKCLGQGPTLIIIRTENDQVLGGYTPIKWVNDNKRNQDDSLTSFIFQANKQQIYPLLKDQKSNATRGVPESVGYLFQFGYGFELIVNNEFEVLTYEFPQAYNTTGYTIQNQEKHLTESKKCQIIEMEVFVII